MSLTLAGEVSEFASYVLGRVKLGPIDSICLPYPAKLPIDP